MKRVQTRGRKHRKMFFWEYLLPIHDGTFGICHGRIAERHSQIQPRNNCMHDIANIHATRQLTRHVVRRKKKKKNRQRFSTWLVKNAWKWFLFGIKLMVTTKLLVELVTGIASQGSGETSSIGNQLSLSKRFSITRTDLRLQTTRQLDCVSRQVRRQFRHSGVHASKGHDDRSFNWDVFSSSRHR